MDNGEYLTICENDSYSRIKQQYFNKLNITNTQHHKSNDKTEFIDISPPIDESVNIKSSPILIESNDDEMNDVLGFMLSNRNETSSSPDDLY